MIKELINYQTIGGMNEGVKGFSDMFREVIHAITNIQGFLNQGFVEFQQGLNFIFGG